MPSFSSLSLLGRLRSQLNPPTFSSSFLKAVMDRGCRDPALPGVFGGTLGRLPRSLSPSLAAGRTLCR